MLTEGQRSDYTMALALIDGLKYGALLADKGYDADYVVKAVQKTGAQVVIPPRSNRVIKRSYDTELYKKRNEIERLFNRLKSFRKIATRYDKLASSFLALLHIAASLVWII